MASYTIGLHPNIAPGNLALVLNAIANRLEGGNTVEISIGRNVLGPNRDQVPFKVRLDTGLIGSYAADKKILVGLLSGLTNFTAEQAEEVVEKACGEEDVSLIIERQ